MQAFLPGYYWLLIVCSTWCVTPVKLCLVFKAGPHPEQEHLTQPRGRGKVLGEPMEFRKSMTYFPGKLQEAQPLSKIFPLFFTMDSDGIHIHTHTHSFIL